MNLRRNAPSDKQCVMGFGHSSGWILTGLILLTSMSSNRSAYTAITPEYAVFPIAHTPIPSGLNPSSSGLHSDLEHEAPTTTSAEEISSRIYSWLASAKDILQRNTGLLLFVASQACLSFMNLAVKILNSRDPPITALEVCLPFIILPKGPI